jgi:hypothetical protein
MLKKFCLAAAACVFFFLILEGLCSSLFVAYQLWSPEEHRTLSGPSVQYDKELGWVSVANFYEKSYYAPNIDLRTNSRGFRANEEFTERVPPGKLRIICSGDSEAFGDGVENDHTWCQDLKSIDDRLQTVNMAETGYGVDQMYLRYQREGSTLDHDVHVFAVVTDDFRRVQYRVVGGYGKPVLKLRNGELVADNVPVPKRSHFLHWLALKPHPLRQFRSLAALAWLVGRVQPARDSAFSNGPTDEQGQILDKMFESLETMEKQKDSVLVLLYLPSRVSDYEQGGASPAWRTWVQAESAKRGIVFVDLIPDFQKLPVTLKDGLFIWPGSVQYFAEAPGHYDDQGHEWVAKELYGRLISIPEVGEKLGLHSEGQITKPGVHPSTRSGSSHKRLE